MLVPPALADTSQPVSRLNDFVIKPEGDLQKVAWHLLDARRQVEAGMQLHQVAAANRLIKLSGDLVQVDVRLNRPAEQTNLALLAEAGLEVTASFGGLVSGLCGLDDLDALAALSVVSTIHPNYGYVTNVGAVTSQGDGSLRADLARANFGVDGSGVKVGVLSDSINNVIGGSIIGGVLTGSDSQQSGDLPVQIEVLDAGAGSGSDEGAAMAELIYDLAPGVDIAFHSAGNDLVSFAGGIVELRSFAGCDVICDDVMYFAEPMFQDGEIAQAVEQAVSDGAAYFSSAGNNADGGMEADLELISKGGYWVHDFTGDGDAFLNVTFGSGGGYVIVVLQWNQPFSGTLGSGSETDLDLFLVDTEQDDWMSQLLTGSASWQGVQGSPSGDPVEIFSFWRDSADTDHIVIQHYAGRSDVSFRLVMYGSGVTFQSGMMGGATIYGHAAASSAMAVAAVDYREIDSDGGHTGGPEINVEDFSSKGGDLPFYYDGSGKPLSGAPVMRFKPDLASVDGTNTTFFPCSTCDTDGDAWPNFFGTSAAAPHAAAVAALFLEHARGAGPEPGPGTVYGAMKIAATDIESSGMDDLSGAGLVYADDALGAAWVTSPTSITGPTWTFLGRAGTYTASGSISTAGDPLEYQFDFGDGEQSSWGAPAAAHSYSAMGSYNVRARARSAVNPGVISGWSAALVVEVGATPPEVLGLSLVGPTKINENSPTQYRAEADFDDGGTCDVSADAVWAISPPQLLVATGDAGVFRSGEVEGGDRVAWVDVAYTDDFGTTVFASLPVTVLDIPAVEPEHTGWQPSAAAARETPSGCCGAAGPVAPFGLAVGFVLLSRAGARRRRFDG